VRSRGKLRIVRVGIAKATFTATGSKTIEVSLTKGGPTLEAAPTPFRARAGGLPTHFWIEAAA
jgi:hypothetical protein